MSGTESEATSAATSAPSTAPQSSLSQRSQASAPASDLPSILQTPMELVNYTFQLRDCKLMIFHETLDKNTSTVYDLMYSVSKKHGDTIETDKVQMYMKVNDDEYRPLKDITQKLSNFDDVDTFYYDFNPIFGSLLIIPNEK